MILIFQQGVNLAKFKIDEEKKMYLWSPAHRKWFPHKENENHVKESIEQIKEKVKEEFRELGFKFIGEKDVRN